MKVYAAHCDNVNLEGEKTVLFANDRYVNILNDLYMTTVVKDCVKAIS